MIIVPFLILLSWRSLSRHWISYSAIVYVHKLILLGPTWSRQARAASIIENWPRVIANKPMFFSIFPIHSDADANDSFAVFLRIAGLLDL